MAGLFEGAHHGVPGIHCRESARLSAEPARCEEMCEVSRMVSGGAGEIM